jgi:hypothetical protein
MWKSPFYCVNKKQQPGLAEELVFYAFHIFVYETTRQMNKLLVRIAAILIHSLLNFIIVSWLLNYDISGSWLAFFIFILVVLVLLYLFIRHIISFIYFIKRN